MDYILIIGAVLILGILALVLRIQNIADVIRGTYHKRVGTSNKVNAALFPIFFIIFTILFIYITVDSEKNYLPAPSSAHGLDIDNMFWTTMIIITAVVFLTHLLLFTFPYVYQFKESRRASFYPDNHRLELIWTIIPGIVLSLLVFSGFKVWTEVTGPAPADHAEVEIVGKQFNWIIRYPGKDNKLGKYNYRMIDDVNTLGIDFADKSSFDDFMPAEIHLPKGKPVLFTIRSRDVLHSVFAMHFRQKMDAVPGMPTSFWFTPTKTTEEMKIETGNPNFVYEIACAEVCGRGHFGMRMTIVVDEPEEYNEWYAAQGSFLSKNPDFMAKVPEALKALAKLQLPADAEKKAESDTTGTPVPAQSAADDNQGGKINANAGVPNP